MVLTIHVESQQAFAVVSWDKENKTFTNYKI